MPYATLQDLIDRFGELELAQRTNRSGLDVIDTVVLGRAQADADSEVDSYLSARYALPLAHVPPVLVLTACDLVRYRLYDDGVPETVRKRYEDATKLLAKFAKGDIRLIGAPELPAADTVADLVQHSFSPRAITDESMAGYA